MSIKQITAVRVSGDVYDLTAEYDSLCEQGSWDYVCRLAASSGVRRVDVLNSYSGEDELAKITYYPTAAIPLASMVRPSMASTCEVRVAEDLVGYQDGNCVHGTSLDVPCVMCPK